VGKSEVRKTAALNQIKRVNLNRKSTRILPNLSPVKVAKDECLELEQNFMVMIVMTSSECCSATLMVRPRQDLLHNG
jgi:hypothetical protein